MNIQQLHALRQEAKRRAAAAATPFDEMRDRVAREHGYSTWQVLLRQVQSPLARMDGHDERV